MAVNEVETYVLLFPNQEWSNTVTDTQIRNEVLRLKPNISFSLDIDNSLRTLSTKNAADTGEISGFLYVPDINQDDECWGLSQAYLPANVTRQSNLPPNDFTLIALAPWINAECTTAWLLAASEDPARAFVFYLPDDSTSEPPDPKSNVWNLPDDDAWRSKYQYPIYAIPGAQGAELMHNLGLYSGNMTDVPWGHDLTELPNVDPRDYVRMYTRLYVDTNAILPTHWVYIIVVFALLVLVCGMISGMMKLVQRARRKSLQERVASGEVNLESLGIKRIILPQSVVDLLPLFTYSAESDAIPTMSLWNLEHGKADIDDIEKKSPWSSTSSLGERLSFSTDVDLPTQLVPVEDTNTVVVHRFLPYSQPKCPICFEKFVDGVSEIRELPCGHIFHQECIDTYLTSSSSLCLLCKKSAVPAGYCPVEITNAMTLRERNLRRLRARLILDPGLQDPESLDGGLFTDISEAVQRSFFGKRHQAVALPRSPPAALSPYREPLYSSGFEQSWSLGENQSRAEFLEQRIQEIADRQTPISDPDCHKPPSHDLEIDFL